MVPPGRLELPHLSALEPKSSASTNSAKGAKTKYCMAANDNYTLKLLQGLAGKKPYRQGSSYVISSAKFEPMFSKSAIKEFVPLVIPRLKK